MKLPYEVILQKIQEQAKIPETEVSSKIQEKMDQLSGLISKDGAAHIIANELGVKLFEENASTRLKISHVRDGMRSVETVGKITSLFDVREFQRKDGGSGKVASFVMGDDTGTIRIVLWNEQTDIIPNLAVGTTVKIVGAYTRDNIRGLELHLATKGEVVINPDGEIIDKVVETKEERKKINELTDTDKNVELLATIVQVFEPRFYEVSPETGRKMTQAETDKGMTPAFAYVMNAVIDDGSSTIRTVFFRNQMANLLNMEHDAIMKFKEDIGGFQTVKDDLLGKMIRLVGRVQKNEMFDRLEFVSQMVFEPDAAEELKKAQ